jgi:hypothetical protein
VEVARNDLDPNSSLGLTFKERGHKGWGNDDHCDGGSDAGSNG